MSLLTIGGVSPAESTYLTLDVTEGRHASGRRTVEIRGTGLTAPDLSAVTWTGAVTFTWPIAQTLGAKSLSVLSTGLQVQTSLSFEQHRVSWSLRGVEASGLAGLVTIGGTDYWAQVSRDPLGGTIQRKSDGSGTLLRAWSKSRVSITGEGGSAPSVSGSVAIVSTLYTGNILVVGVSANLDPETGLVRWTVAGEQP